MRRVEAPTTVNPTKSYRPKRITIYTKGERGQKEGNLTRRKSFYAKENRPMFAEERRTKS